jgi:predicted porin
MPACFKTIVSISISKNMKNLNVLASSAILACAFSAPAFAQLQATGGSCTASLSGQLKGEHWTKSGGNLPGTNKDTQEFFGFADIQLDNNCKLTSDTNLEMRLRQRPLKGSNFDIQGDSLGSREAWVGFSNTGLGKVRYGRFLNKMNSVLDYPYGAPSLNAQAADYGSTPSAPTRFGSLRYISPTFYGIDLETTIGGAPENRDIELYAQYKIAGFQIDAIHSRSKMNGAYQQAGGAAYTFDNARSLTNTATFLGARYEFKNSARVTAGFKNNIFSYPVGPSGVYNPTAAFRQETAINELVLAGQYPLAPKWTASAGLVRFLDSKTRGVTADDGATLFGALISYAVTPAFSINLELRQTRLDRVGAIPGSVGGVNNIIPSTTRGPLDFENRQWVFEQGGTGFNSKKVNYAAVTVQYSF